MRRMYMENILRELENLVCYVGDIIDERDGAELDLNDLWQWLESVMIEVHRMVHEE